MLRRKLPTQLELFVSDPLEQLVPDDPVLARVDRVLDPGFVRRGRRLPLRQQRASEDGSRERGTSGASRVPDRDR